MRHDTTRHDYRAECEACGTLEQHEGDFDALFIRYVHSECGFEVDPVEAPMCPTCIDNPEAVRTVREAFED